MPTPSPGLDKVAKTQCPITDITTTATTTTLNNPVLWQLVLLRHPKNTTPSPNTEPRAHKPYINSCKCMSLIVLQYWHLTLCRNASDALWKLKSVSRST